MCKRIALLLLLLATAARLGATAQAPDVIKLSGKIYDLNSNPLSPELAAKLPEPAVVSTDLWRGYIATWEVRGTHLVLVDVAVPTKDYGDYDAPESKRFRSGMPALFGRRGARRATWYTGNLIVPTGEMVDYVHMGYASTYSSYIVLTIIEGTVTKQQALDQREFEAFRRAQFEKFKKTPEYAELLAEAKKGDEPMDEKTAEEFIYVYASGAFLSRVFK